MNALIQCPGCRRKLQVPESLQGQDVQCPTCGQTFVAGAVEPPRSDTPPPPPNAALGQEYPAPARDNHYDDREEFEYEEDDRYDDEEDDRERRRRRYRRRDLEPHRGGLVLTMGILSIVLFCANCAVSITFIPGLILGPVAWGMGHRDLREIQAGRMDPDGEGSTRGGYVCAIIGTVLNGLVLVAVIGVVFFLLFAAGANW